MICAALVAAGGVAGALGITNPRRTVKAEGCPGGQLSGRTRSPSAPSPPHCVEAGNAERPFGVFIYDAGTQDDSQPGRRLSSGDRFPPTTAVTTTEGQNMRGALHPTLVATTATCGNCGTTFAVRSTTR